MTKKIFNSIFAAVLAVFIVSVLLIGGVLFSYLGTVQRDSLSEQANIIAGEVNKNGYAYLKAFSSDTYRLTLIEKDGTVSFDNMKAIAEMENHADREEIKEALIAGSGSSDRYSKTLLEKTYYEARLLENGDVIRVAVTKSSVWTLFLGLLQPGAAVLIIAFVLSIILSYRLSGRIVKPLEELDLENPLENDTYDELSAVLSKIDRQRKELREQADELRQKRDEFSAVTENMTEGLILIGAKSEVLSINTAAKKIFAAEDCIGKNIITVNRTPAFQEAAEKALSGKACESTLNINEHNYQINATPVMIGEKAAGVCLLIFDITDKNENERIRKEFTANVSHELKTPLHSIMGASELLLNGMVKPEDEKDFSKRIYNDASRLLTLVDDIIRLSQLDEGAAPAPESVSLKACAAEAADAVKEAAEKKNVTVSVCGDDVIIPGVPRLVYEIAYNLADNAVRYNNDNGSVNVSVTDAGDSAILEVSDTGIGVPQDSITRIFERFYRVDKSHSRDTGGTGLGLSIVKHAAEYLGAEISIESTLGKGTSISVRFPKG